MRDSLSETGRNFLVFSLPTFERKSVSNRFLLVFLSSSHVLKQHLLVQHMWEKLQQEHTTCLRYSLSHTPQDVYARTESFSQHKTCQTYRVACMNLGHTLTYCKKRKNWKKSDWPPCWSLVIFQNVIIFVIFISVTVMPLQASQLPLRAGERHFWTR